MTHNSELLTIRTDEEGAAELGNVAKQHADIRFHSLKIQAQVGDPDTWMFVAELTRSALPYLSAAILLLIRQRKIKYVEIGGNKYYDITPEQFERLMRIHEQGKHDG